MLTPAEQIQVAKIVADMIAKTGTPEARIADAIERIETIFKPPPMPHVTLPTQPFVDANANPLADDLLQWFVDQGVEPPAISGMLQDAIRQATKPETIDWLASLAERYGFKRS